MVKFIGAGGATQVCNQAMADSLDPILYGDTEICINVQDCSETQACAAEIYQTDVVVEQSGDRVTMA